MTDNILNENESMHRGSIEPVLIGTRSVLTQQSSGFPEALRDIPRPPETLRVIGSAESLQSGISIIGARKATPYGRGCSRRFARIASSLGITVVSGGALGCDTEAHLGALDVGGTTVAVLGGGCDYLYPKRNKSIFQRIVDTGGAVISERDWSEPPLPWMFRDRNRIIAGLSKATLVVEAGLPSGTFSTADEALAAGRDVLAVPGSITSPTSAGANRLIAQGAYPVVDDETFESALNTLYGSMKHPASNDGRIAQPEDPLIEALMANPMRPDEIIALRLVDNALELPRILAEHERRGFITRYPDGRYGPAQSWVMK